MFAIKRAPRFIIVNNFEGGENAAGGDFLNKIS